MKIKGLLARISDLPNAYRVLDIMDNAGCDIEPITDRNCRTYYRIKPKWYFSKQESEDLRAIILFKEHYKKRSKIWYLIFHNVREGYRFLYQWKRYSL